MSYDVRTAVKRGGLLPWFGLARGKERSQPLSTSHTRRELLTVLQGHELFEKEDDAGSAGIACTGEGGLRKWERLVLDLSFASRELGFVELDMRTNAQLHSRSISSSRSMSIQPPPYTRSQNTSRKASSITSSGPITGSVSHPKGGNDFCVFFNFRRISVWESGHCDIVVVMGVLNWRVAFNGASVLEKPAVEKSVQFNVARLAARALRNKIIMSPTSRAGQPRC